MNAKKHWDEVYGTKEPSAVSWFEPHAAKSLELILGAEPDREASLIDVGGGNSMLVDGLLGHGFHNVTVLDISGAALRVALNRLGKRANEVTWLEADITQALLPPDYYSVWHDRAVFHFLVKEDDRQAYIRKVTESLKTQGHIIMATFGPNGPERCSGLEVVRYSASSLQATLGEGFDLMHSSIEMHQTPAGALQEFVYSVFRKR